jgi:hypothetical protein
MFELGTRRLSYVNAYKALVNHLSEDGVYVIDKAPGWTLPPSKTAYLFIPATLGRKRRLYALAHEVGHLYCWPTPKGKIKRSTTKLRSEGRANEFAIRVCKILTGLDIRKDYKYFKKRIKQRRKYLRSVYGGLELREMVV